MINIIITFTANDIKRTRGIKEVVKVTIIDLNDKGPVTIFWLKKK